MTAGIGRGFLDFLLGRNIWVRFTRGLGPAHVRPWYFYLTVIPWPFALGWAGAALRLARRRGAAGPDAVVCLVPLLYVAIASLGASKLAQYLDPARPLLAVAAGALVNRCDYDFKRAKFSKDCRCEINCSKFCFVKRLFAKRKRKTNFERIRRRHSRH